MLFLRYFSVLHLKVPRKNNINFKTNSRKRNVITSQLMGEGGGGHLTKRHCFLFPPCVVLVRVRFEHLHVRNISKHVPCIITEFRIRLKRQINFGVMTSLSGNSLAEKIARLSKSLCGKRYWVFTLYR